MNSEIMTAERAELAPVSLENLVAQIAQSDSMTTEKVEVIERLVALMERREAQQRKERFDEAHRRVQARVTRVAKNGLMDRGAGKGQIPYAKREDVDAMVRPIYLEEGFSIDWDAPMTSDGGKIHIRGRFNCAGHTEIREITFAPDASGGKTGPQATGSSVAYGQRYVEKMFWNILDEGADANGADVEATKPITQDQADTIRTELADIKADMPRFYRLFGVAALEDLRVSQLTEVYARIKQAKEKRA